MRAHLCNCKTWACLWHSLTWIRHFGCICWEVSFSCPYLAAWALTCVPSTRAGCDIDPQAVFCRMIGVSGSDPKPARPSPKQFYLRTLSLDLCSACSILQIYQSSSNTSCEWKRWIQMRITLLWVSPLCCSLLQAKWTSLPFQNLACWSSWSLYRRDHQSNEGLSRFLCQTSGSRFNTSSVYYSRLQYCRWVQGL